MKMMEKWWTPIVHALDLVRGLVAETPKIFSVKMLWEALQYIRKVACDVTAFRASKHQRVLIVSDLHGSYHSNITAINLWRIQIESRGHSYLRQIAENKPCELSTIVLIIDQLRTSHLWPERTLTYSIDISAPTLSDCLLYGPSDSLINSLGKKGKNAYGMWPNQPLFSHEQENTHDGREKRVGRRKNS